jgi:ribokinase
VVDTTGAGDTFTGYLAAGLAAGGSLDDACARAVVAGALAVETAGAVTSIPAAAQVDMRVAR